MDRPPDCRRDWRQHRRETATRYLRAAGLLVRGRGRLGEAPANAAISSEVFTDAVDPPLSRPGVSADAVPAVSPGRALSASACEPYRHAW